MGRRESSSTTVLLRLVRFEAVPVHRELLFGLTSELNDEDWVSDFSRGEWGAVGASGVSPELEELGTSLFRFNEHSRVVWTFFEWSLAFVTEEIIFYLCYVLKMRVCSKRITRALSQVLERISIVAAAAVGL